MVSGIQNVSFYGEIPAAEGGTRVVVVGPPRRKEDLPEDTVELSTKKKDKEEKSLLNSTCDVIGKGVKSFVDLTVNAFAKAGSEVLVDRTIGKITGK